MYLKSLRLWEVVEMEAKDRMTEAALDQVLCERHGARVQRRLKGARVGIAGLGGLGSNIAMALTRAGVGALKLVDFDKVELSNLNRQHYSLAHLGLYKTEALARQLLAVNPYLKLELAPVRINRSNLPQLFAACDILCEAFDVPENKAMLVNGALELLPQVPVVAGSGIAGYGPANEITTRRMNARLYICGDNHSEIKPEQGLMAPRVLVCAAHQANMIVRLLLGENTI